MGMFTKTERTPDDGTRRLPDEPLDGQYGRTLPLLQRVFIRVLVSEMRKMMDERDAEQRPILGRVGVEVVSGITDAEPIYRDRTEQDG